MIKSDMKGCFGIRETRLPICIAMQRFENVSLAVCPACNALSEAPPRTEQEQMLSILAISESVLLHVGSTFAETPANECIIGCIEAAAKMVKTNEKYETDKDLSDVETYMKLAKVIEFIISSARPT